MELTHATKLFDTLGHPARLAVLRLLVRRAPDELRPSEIADALDVKRNTLSTYLSALSQAGLVRSRRDGTSLFYGLNSAALGALVGYLVQDCCRGRPEICMDLTGADLPAKDRYRVLFVCTGNSARSIFAEALLRDLGGARFEVHSAGTRPAERLNPFALDLLKRNGHDLDGLRAKDIAAFRDDDAPGMDFVFTVCDLAANEECPPWPGQPVSAHWGLPDPVKAQGSDAERALAFAETYRQMRQRIQAFANLNPGQLDRASLQRRLDQIGQMDDTNPG